VSDSLKTRGSKGSQARKSIGEELVANPEDAETEDAAAPDPRLHLAALLE
jgi:hypothetical protein